MKILSGLTALLHTPVSVVHVLAALLSLFLGTGLLLTQKGTRRHRLAGYTYTVSMLLVNSTAFRLYYLFGHFGIVHVGAVGSLLMLSGGIGVAMVKRPGWLLWHYWLMGASVTGLYAAGLVESLYRFFPAAYFWPVCLGLSLGVFLTGVGLMWLFQDSGKRSLNPWAPATLSGR